MNRLYALVFGSRAPWYILHDNIETQTIEQRREEAFLSLPGHLTPHHRYLWMLATLGDKRQVHREFARLALPADEFSLCSVSPIAAEDIEQMSCAECNSRAARHEHPATGYDPGLLIEKFYTKSLLHNVDAAIKRYENTTHRSFDDECVQRHLYTRRMLLRSVALETALDVMARLHVGEHVHMTNSLAVRLVIAARVNDVEQVEDLLRRHVRVSSLYGLAVMEAIRASSYESLCVLLDRRGNFDLGRNRSSALVLAATQRDKRIFALIFFDEAIQFSAAAAPAVIGAIVENNIEFARHITCDRRWIIEDVASIVQIALSMRKGEPETEALIAELTRAMKESEAVYAQETEHSKLFRQEVEEAATMIREASKTMSVQEYAKFCAQQEESLLRRLENAGLQITINAQRSNQQCVY